MNDSLNSKLPLESALIDGEIIVQMEAGIAVSPPLSWDELGAEIRSDHFTVGNLPRRLGFLESDPWQGFLTLRQALPDGAKPSGTTRKSGATAKRAGPTRK